MNTNNIGRVLVSIVVVCGFMTVTLLYLTQKYTGVPPGETLTLLVGALATNFSNVVGYWIGSSSGSTAKDEQNAKVAEKLAEKVMPQAPAPTAPWWNKLTDAERAAIEGAATAATPDTRAAEFITAAKLGAASGEDLNYLTTKGLLTADRALEIQKS